MTDKAHDYDEKYSVDPNSGLAPQPGGLGVPGGENKDLLVDENDKIVSVEGNDVTSKSAGEQLEQTGNTGDPQAIGEDPAKTGTGEEAPREATGTPEGTATGTDDGQDSGEAYDPSKHPVSEVKAYVAEHPDEKDAILAAEKGGQNRPTLVSALEG